MIKLVLLGVATFFGQCSGEEATFTASVHVRVQRELVFSDSVTCYNYFTYSLVPYFLRQLYQITYKVEVDMDAIAMQNQLLSPDMFCLFSLSSSGEFGSLLENDALSNTQPVVNGSITLVVHVQDFDMFWIPSYRCISERPTLFLEIKEFNLSFRYYNTPPLLVQFLGKVTDLYCSSRIY